MSIPHSLSAVESFWHTIEMFSVRFKRNLISHLALRRALFPVPVTVPVWEMPQMLGKMLWSLWNGHSLGADTFRMKFLEPCEEFCPCKRVCFKSSLTSLITEEMHWCALLRDICLTGGLPVCSLGGNQWFLRKSLFYHTNNSSRNLCCGNAQRVIIWLETPCARLC